MNDDERTVFVYDLGAEDKRRCDHRWPYGPSVKKRCKEKARYSTGYLSDAATSIGCKEHIGGLAVALLERLESKNDAQDGRS